MGPGAKVLKKELKLKKKGHGVLQPLGPSFELCLTIFLYRSCYVVLTSLQGINQSWENLMYIPDDA